MQAILPARITVKFMEKRCDLMRKLTMLSLLLLALLLLAACNTAVEEAAVVDTAVQSADEMSQEDEMADSEEEMQDDAMDSEDDMMDSEEEMEDDAMDSDDDMMDSDDDTHDGAMDSEDDAMAEGEEMADEEMMLAVWQEIPLVNARTGETFTLADFSGKTIFIEPMATWCTNCRRQLNNVKQARTDLNSDEIVFIGLSLETNLDAATLAAYADNQGYEWLFAVMTPELLQAMAEDFGQVLTSAPSTPHFVIRPDGTFTELATGIESPEEISAQLLAASG